MPIIPCAEWIPDAADIGNPGTTVVINAIPGPTGYKPMPEHTVLTGALDARARGAIDIRDKNLNVYQYAGDAAKLYRLVTTTWTDSSIGGGYSTASEEIWDFIRWKNQVIATNFSNNIQFLELAGTTFANLTTDFRCRRLATVGDFVVAANTYDVTDGLVPDRVRWSGFNDETDWTVSPTTGSDVRDLKGGPILKVYGGEHGVILSRDSVWRMSFEGAPTWFRIDETVPGVGTLGPGASSRIGNTIFSMAENGFHAITNGTGSTPIGTGRVDAFIREDLDSSYLHRITSVADARSGRVFWAYPGAAHTAGTPKRILVYDVGLNRFGLI